jgi:cytochrome c oxidase subunit II
MTNILIALVLILLVATLVQVLRVSELLSELKKQDVNEVTDKDNAIQGKILLIVGTLFLGSVVWQFVNWIPLMLPPASSVHGAVIDSLMQFTMLLIIFVFFITQPLLFWYGYKYNKNKNNPVAFFYPHNNKLEVIWTVVPTIVLTAVILYGLSAWQQITDADTSDSQVIELYAKQFDWTARYAGEDNTLGYSNYKLVKGPNQLGVDLTDEFAQDDVVIKEVHIAVNKPVLLKMRSRDVIHSAFLPHFRVQMNCVPGMITQFAFTPTQTTAEMKIQEGEDFEFVLLCNKICGAAHYNMQMKFVVETQEEYDTWMASQKTVENTLTLKTK